MGTGRTLNKDPRTRPIKSPGEKLRRSKAQRARLVKFGMDKAAVAKMQTEEVRKLVQRPVLVKKIAAKAKVEVVAKPAEAAAKPAAPKKPAAKTAKKKD